MLGWIIILVIAVVLFFVGVYISDNHTGFGLFLVTVATVAIIFGVATMIASPVTASKSIAIYEKQYAYFNEYVTEDALDDAAITAKKIELNEWLYEAQWSRQRFGIFSFMPERVMELKLIE